jgi:ZIP family zinc transporter
LAVGAFLLAAFAQSSLLVSGLIVYRFHFSAKVIGGLAGFGAGALLSAVSFDLIPQASALVTVESALLLLAGAAVFIVADRLVESRFGGDDSGNPLGIVVGAIVDGVPESLIFGIAVTTGDPISIAFVAAVWISNVPQALAPSSELAGQGWSITKTGSMWGAVVLACALTAVLGYGIGENFSSATGAGAAAFAAGGVIAMLTDSLIPFAYSKGGRQAGLWTVVGFAVTLAMV